MEVCEREKLLYLFTLFIFFVPCVALSLVSLLSLVGHSIALAMEKERIKGSGMQYGFQECVRRDSVRLFI